MNSARRRADRRPVLEFFPVVASFGNCQLLYAVLLIVAIVAMPTGIAGAMEKLMFLSLRYAGAREHRRGR
jgi:hypothetical protein